MSHTIVLTMVDADGNRWKVAGELSSVMAKENATGTERVLAMKDKGLSVVDFMLLFNEEDD